MAIGWDETTWSPTGSRSPQGQVGWTTDNELRLNIQHYMWKAVCGFNIHPSIPVTRDHRLKIADVGTGTGYASLATIIISTTKD